jgi:hypothetical protein
VTTAAAAPKLGLMLPPSQEATPLYNELIAPLFKPTPARSIEQQLKGLTEANRNTVLMLVRHGKMLSSMASFGADLSSYRELLQTYAESDAPLLPYGYPIMTLVALVPPLWRRRMNPRVKAWRARYYPEIVDWTPYKDGTNPLPR